MIGKIAARTATFFGVVLLIAATPALAGVIAGSAHDFSTGPSAGWSGGRICVACHTPHNAMTTGSPASSVALWNHTVSSASYTMYTSPTMKAGTGTAGASSKLCLSCHDGTVAVDSFGGRVGTINISSANNVGFDLSNDHPIGITYDTTTATANGSLFDPAGHSVTIGTGTQTKTGSIATTLLYGGQLECSSCHDVHNTFTVGAPVGSGMVKIDPAGSKICLACHNK